MDVNFNASSKRWISPIKVQAETAGETKSDAAPLIGGAGKADQVIISSQGRQAAEQGAEPFSELKKTVNNEELRALVKAAREKSGNLEVNWDETVDPGGKIFSRTYVESLVNQYKKATDTIESYYSQAHEENLKFDDPYAHIMQKYKISDSPYFRRDLAKSEREMAFEQERQLLWGGNVTLKDPYALESSGGVLNAEDADKIAKQDARNKLDELIKERMKE